MADSVGSRVRIEPWGERRGDRGCPKCGERGLGASPCFYSPALRSRVGSARRCGIREGSGLLILARWQATRGAVCFRAPVLPRYRRGVGLRHERARASLP